MGTGCIGAAKERRNDDEVCERTSSPATLKPGAKVQSCLRGLWYLLISADLPLIKVYYTPAHVTVRSVFGGTLLVVLRPKVTPKSDSSPPNFLGLICRQKKKVQRSISLDCRCGSLFKDSSIFFPTSLFHQHLFSASQFYENWELIQSPIWLDRYPQRRLQRGESYSTIATQTQTMREQRLEALASR